MDNEEKTLLANLGKAIAPSYSTTNVNEPLTLYRGPVTIEFGDGIKIPDARLTWEWRREPVILCHYSPSENQIMAGDAFDVLNKPHKIILDNLKVSGWIRCFEGLSCGSSHHETLELLSPIVIGEIASVNSVKIHLVNCHDRSEEGVRTEGGGYIGKGRLTLRSRDWSCLIDKVPEHDKLVGQLNKYGGQAITHVASISRVDNSTFTVETANEVLEGLRDFISFSTGSKPRFCLASGYLKDAEPSWQIWEACASSTWTPLSNWSLLDFNTGQVSLAFPGYIDKTMDNDWRNALSLACNWYVQAKTRGTETCLVLGQAALELLASVLFETSVSKPWPKDTWKGKWASQRINWALNELGVDTALPPLLAALSGFRFPDKNKPFENGPHAITAIRNAITHPSGEKFSQFGQHMDALSHEASKLVLFFLEHALLSVIGFNGIASAESTHGAWIDYSEHPSR